MNAAALRLENPVREYDWGSVTAIPELLGVPPTGRPQAELWLGAHPSAPSRLAGAGTLTELVEADPEAVLGLPGLTEFGPRLPFLLKVLAAARPLSLQAHPTAVQAEQGYAAEEARGIPPTAAERNYKDRSHKPEVLCALTPFRALAGFRDPARTARLLAGLDAPGLARYRGLLAAGAGGLREVVTAVLTLPAGQRADLVAEVAAACRAGDPADGFAAERAVALDLAAAYPGDPGVVIALLLNLVELAPGQALFLPAGNLHAYLSGTGVELMANSDNVLRGGLTGKHIDVPELLRVLDFRPTAAPLVTPRPGPDGGLDYPAPVREFRLTRFDVTTGPAVTGPAATGPAVTGPAATGPAAAGPAATGPAAAGLAVTGPAAAGPATVAPGAGPFTLDGGAPQILLCVGGSVELSDVDGAALGLPRGGAAFVPAGRKAFTLTGHGTVFRATTNLSC